jgi:hypothetical protein
MVNMNLDILVFVTIDEKYHGKTHTVVTWLYKDKDGHTVVT